MISRRELAYVDKPLGSVPYPGDAYAYKVNILFDFTVSNPCIVVSDDGVGMTRETIENVWAVVATPYKRKNPTITRNGKIRRVSGNKGMGRFSSAKLGKKVDIYTKHKDDGFMHIQIDWNEILYLNCWEILEHVLLSAI